MSDVVALLLDDAMPSERLGALLRAARKRRGMNRKHAAAAAGTTPGKLRKYERGDLLVPAAVCARLAECYGDDLTAHVPLRVPLQIAPTALSAGSEHQPIGTDIDDVVAGYIDLVHRLRKSEPGDPLSLRTVDIVALAGALGRDRATIEARIVEALGCTPAEARHLHGELLRRKVILPVAGLAAGMAAFAGVAYAAQTPGTSARVQTHTIAVAAPTTTVPAPVTTTTVQTAPTPTPTTVPATTPTTAAPQPSTPPTTAAQGLTNATVPADQQPTDVPVTAAAPQPDPNDPPVSVLPGESPISVIGSPDSTSQTP